jgi:RNA polymerase sigma-70 factor, ECF subfamily
VRWKSDNSNDANNSYLVYLDALFQYAMVLTRNHAEAEDLVQEAILRSLKAKETFAEAANRKGWLFTVLRNAWLNQVKRRRKWPELSLIEEDVSEYVPGNTMDTHEKYEQLELQGQVREAIQRLPRSFREIVLLREFEGLCYKEIASLLNCAEGTVMSRLGRARSKLRAILANHNETVSSATEQPDKGGT